MGSCSVAGSHLLSNPSKTHTAHQQSTHDEDEANLSCDDRKMFIGGLNWETTDRKPRPHPHSHPPSRDHVLTRGQNP